MSKIITVITITVALAACAHLNTKSGLRERVLVGPESGQCRPVALTGLENAGDCRIQVVAKAETNQVLRSTPWIDVGDVGGRFELPTGYRWVVLEVDPGCSAHLGTVRYAVDRSCEPALAAGR